MTSPDQRSVGELLLEADHIARAVLMDVDDLDPAAMLRTWGEVVQAASELWQALPPVRPPEPGTERRLLDSADLTIQRLQEMTLSMHRVTRGATWPGDGPSDEQLLRIAENLTRAADLVGRHRTPQHPLTGPELRDLQAAKTRIMHTLYIGTHGVAVAVGRHVRDLERTMAGQHALPSGESLKLSRAAHSRILAFERLAGAVVAGTYPRHLDGEYRETPDTGRLARALAVWDVQAHRTLATRLDTADLMVSSHSQALILSAGSTLMRAAAVTGSIDEHQYNTRLAPALEKNQEGWMLLAGHWRDLTPPSARRVNPDLARAAQELRAVLHDLVRDRTTLATPSLIARRTDLRDATTVMHQALAANVDLAHVVGEATTRSELNGAARGVNTMAVKLHEPRDPQTIDASPLAAWVSPRDHATNRAVRLPNQVRAALTAVTDELDHLSRTALSAGAFLTASTKRTVEADRSGQASAVGRRREDRLVTRQVGVHANPRCER